MTSRLNPYITFDGRAREAMEFHQPGTNVSVSLSGDDGDALRSYWEQLSEGGNVTVPLEKQVWGDEFGSLIDRFGIGWLVNIGQPQG